MLGESFVGGRKASPSNITRQNSIHGGRRSILAGDVLGLRRGTRMIGLDLVFIRSQHGIVFIYLRDAQITLLKLRNASHMYAETHSHSQHLCPDWGVSSLRIVCGPDINCATFRVLQQFHVVFNFQ